MSQTERAQIAAVTSTLHRTDAGATRCHGDVAVGQKGARAASARKPETPPPLPACLPAWFTRADLSRLDLRPSLISPSSLFLSFSTIRHGESPVSCSSSVHRVSDVMESVRVSLSPSLSHPSSSANIFRTSEPLNAQLQ
ncbi:Hypothetical predicted protein [Scomber scombrus]|uniref:Uncharacterized protein n=1 Tax=Scomber scombrus TaxID=13677 RepID=A0AAV1PUJ4_SCOSC